MSLVVLLQRTTLMVVLLFVLACGDDEGFEPAPGATVALSDLDALIENALSGFDLQREPLLDPQPDTDGGYASCFKVESGPCSVPRPPEALASFRAKTGPIVVVRLALGVDSVEAGDLVSSTTQGRSRVATESLRIVSGSAPVPASRAVGPCVETADPTGDKGCAWESRGAPDVGDEARAMRSDSLDAMRLSAVAFARGHVFADVQVASSDGDVPDRLANQIAKALDEQIMLVLSR
jgi:hypothetical protein